MAYILETEANSDDEQMVTAPSSPQHQFGRITLQEYYTRKTTSATEPAQVPDKPSVVAKRQKSHKKSIPRVVRNVSLTAQQKIKEARGNPSNRQCGVCQHQSTGRRLHAIHVASHFTRYMCDCGHLESNYQELLQHRKHHPDPTTVITEISRDIVEKQKEPALSTMSSELRELKKIQRRLVAKIAAKEERLKIASTKKPTA